MKQVLFIIIALIAASSNVSAEKIARDSVRIGNNAFKEQRYHEAEINFKSAKAHDPKSKEASFNLANTYYKQSKWDEALKEYEHYLTLENANPQKMGAAWHNVGNTFLKKKDLQKSMESYKKALRLNPNDEDSRYNLAVVQKILKDKKDDDKDNKDDKKDDKKEQQQQDKQQDKQDQKQKPEQKPEQQENQQMSQENVNQILKALEQDEKETQEKIKQMKAAERRKQNQDNKRQNKDW